MTTKHGIPHSNQNFFGILELYNPETCTFFTIIKELGMLLEEMHFVTGLPPGECFYEKYIRCEEELESLKRNKTKIYETY